MKNFKSSKLFCLCFLAIAIAVPTIIICAILGPRYRVDFISFNEFGYQSIRTSVVIGRSISAPASPFDNTYKEVKQYASVDWFENVDCEGEPVKFPYKPTGDVKLYSKVNVKSNELDLPVVTIDTDEGAPITSLENYVNATIVISNVANTAHALTARSEVRLRGNSTVDKPKKPYRLKFSSKQSLFGSAYKAKSWVLLAEWSDPSLMKNFTAFTLAKQMGGVGFSQTAEFVQVVVNGKYQGTYLLTDQVQEQSDCRIDIETDIDGMTEIPFILCKSQIVYLQKDYPNGLNINYFTDGEFGYEIKYPESPTPAQFNYIKNFFDECKSALESKNRAAIENVIDVDSFIDFFLVHEYMFNHDSIWGNGYMYKRLDDNKMYFGPVWDFDISLYYSGGLNYFGKMSEAEKNLYTTGNTWLKKFIQNEELYNKYIARWLEIEGTVNDVIQIVKEKQVTIKNAALVNEAIWFPDKAPRFNKPKSQKGPLFTQQCDYVVKYFEKRLNFFNNTYVAENYYKFKV